MTYSRKCNGTTFLDLPTEIFLEIMKSSADLSSLCSLIAASSTVASLFDTNAAEIINAVMTATAVPKQIQVLMGAVIKIQTCSFECKNLDEAISGLSFKNLKPLNHDRNVPPKQFRDLVNQAHKIHSLAHSCLNHYIQRCMGLEPSRPIDPKFYYGCCGMPMGSTDGERYQLKDLGPPSWIEEQRVIRILWIMQVFFELRIALNEGRLDHWSEEDKSKLEDMHVTDFHEPLELFGEELILTMVDFFEELQTKRQRQGDAASIHQFQLPETTIETFNFNWNCSPQPHFNSEKEDEWKQGKWEVGRISIGWRFCKWMAKDPKSPLRYIPFTPFRKYGFAIWDAKRMNDWGFLEPRKKRAYGIMPPVTSISHGAVSSAKKKTKLL